MEIYIHQLFCCRRCYSCCLFSHCPLFSLSYLACVCVCFLIIVVVVVVVINNTMNIIYSRLTMCATVCMSSCLLFLFLVLKFLFTRRVLNLHSLQLVWYFSRNFSFHRSLSLLSVLLFDFNNSRAHTHIHLQDIRFLWLESPAFQSVLSTLKGRIRFNSAHAALSRSLPSESRQTSD